MDGLAQSVRDCRYPCIVGENTEPVNHTTRSRPLIVQPVPLWTVSDPDHDLQANLDASHLGCIGYRAGRQARTRIVDLATGREIAAWDAQSRVLAEAT